MTIKKISTLLILLTFAIISCKSDDSKEETYLCCSDNPFNELNVNNLDGVDSSLILIPDVFTPNSDGVNDNYFIIRPYTATLRNHSVVIYDLNENIVFESNNGVFFDGKNQNTGEELEFGSYKYKVVIENEQTFVQYGYLCLIRNKSEVNGFDFSNCIAPQTFHEADPILIN